MKFDRRKSLIQCMLFCLALAMLVAYDLRSSYLREEENTRTKVANSSYLISEWIKAAFETSDYVLRDIVSQVPLAELLSPDSDPAQHARRMAFLEGKLKTLPNAFTFALYDGQCIATHTKTVAKFDASQREYCQLLRADPEADSVVTHAFFSSLGPLNVVQARRFQGDSPGFHGFAMIGIDLGFFSKLLQQISVGHSGTIAILDTRLVLLARMPAMPEILGTKAKDPSLIFQSFLSSAERSISFRAPSPVDGKDRLYGMRKVDDLPFIVSVGEADDEWLSRWRSRAWDELIATLLLSGMAIFILRNHWILAARTADLEDAIGKLEDANTKLADLSATDGLTGLANRRRFDQVLASEWARASRNGRPLAVLMLDIDRFKEFNDRHGHQAGDECLRSIAQVLRASAQRATDLVARYGGEEFSLVLPDTDVAAARRLAEAVRQSIEALDIAHELSSDGRVTISIGVAAMVFQAPKDADSLLYAADMALYRAKQGGRNQVQVAEDSGQEALAETP